MTRSEFRALLNDVWLHSGADFSGIGIIVCNKPFDLPIINLRQDAPDISGTTVEALSSLSSSKSIFHDGFHILNEIGEITHVAQYFSPPIVREAYFDRRRPVGGRFVAGLFGSALSGVLMTGIVSEGLGLSVFENGQETHFEILK